MLCTHNTTILCQFGLFVTSLPTCISINSQPFPVGIVSVDTNWPKTVCQFGLFVTSLPTCISINSQPFPVGIVSVDTNWPKTVDKENSGYTTHATSNKHKTTSQLSWPRDLLLRHVTTSKPHSCTAYRPPPYPPDISLE